MSAQKAGLRNIGGDDIRQGKKLLHLCAVLRGDGAVGFSVITHDGIENYWRPCRQGFRLLYFYLGNKKIPDDSDLLHAAKKTAVDPIKGQLQLLPFFQVLRQDRGAVVPKNEPESRYDWKKLRWEPGRPGLPWR